MTLIVFYAVYFFRVDRQGVQGYMEVELVLLFMCVDHGQWKAMNLLGFFSLVFGLIGSVESYMSLVFCNISSLIFQIIQSN